MNRFVGITAAGIASLVASATAQTTLQTISGTTPLEQLGRSVACVGDVNNDGWGDFAIGEPFKDSNGADAGTVKVISGRNGNALYTFNGLFGGDRFGESVAPAGDINKDGFADFIVGAPNNDQVGSNAGMARVYSGQNGSVLYTFVGVAAGDWFGSDVDRAGDVNNDGWEDLIVGAPYGKGATSSNVGVARVFSGRNGSVLHTFTSPVGISLLGASVSGAGDVDLDGFADLVIGAPQASYSASDAGRVWLFSGRTGAALRFWDGVGAGTYFGGSVDGAGDVNNDGYPDVVIGIQFADYNGGNSGSAEVHSGKNGSVLYRFNGDHGTDELGTSVAGAGDVDGDGYKDIVAGCRLNDFKGANAGMARVWSGRTGQILFSVYGSQVDEFFGHSVDGGGDLDNDGLADVLVGWPSADFNGQDSGRVRAFSARPLPITTYCVAKTNSLGCKPAMTSSGTPSASGTAPFMLRATQVLNQHAGILFYGSHGQVTPFQGGMLCVKSPFVRTNPAASNGSASGNDCSGVLSMDMNAWIRSHKDASLGVGDTVYAQWWYRDSSASFGSGYSNGIFFTVMP